MRRSSQITVITATFNRADVLHRAVESVCSQTVSPFEYIIVDDGSTDDTARLLNEYDDPQITTISLDENRGPAAAWNHALKQVTTAYTTFLDSDDEYLPHRVERTIETLDRHPNTGGVVHAFESVRNRETTRRSVPNGCFTREQMVDRNPIGGTSNTAYRTAALRDIDGFDESFPSSIDYELQLRMAKAHGLVGINEVLCRKYDGGSDRIQRTPKRVIAGHKQLIEKHGSDLTAQNIAKRRARIGREYLRLGQKQEALDEFDHALSCAPAQGRPQIHHVIGISLLEHDENTHARMHFSQALRNEPWRYKSWISAAVTFIPVNGTIALTKLRGIRNRVSR